MSGGFNLNWLEFALLVNSEADNPIPGFHLEQNYPKLFNPCTTLSNKLPDHSTVSLRVYGVINVGGSPRAQGASRAEEEVRRRTTLSLPKGRFSTCAKASVDKISVSPDEAHGEVGSLATILSLHSEAF